MSAYPKTEILRSSREREKKMKNKERLLGLLVLFVVVGGFLSFLNFNFFRLTTFNLLGQTSQDLGAIKQTINGELNGRHLLVIPKNSVFFFSKDNLATLLEQKFPGLQSVEIDSPNLNTLTIKLADRDSKVLWCNVLDKSKICFYLNDEGLVYQAAPNFSDSIIMEFDSETLVRKLNTKVIDPRDLAQAKLFLNFLKTILVDWPSSRTDFKLSSVEVLPLQDFEAAIVSTVDPNNSWKLLFNTGASADKLITNFHSLVKDPTLTRDWSLGLSASNSQASKNIDYLDLRFDNKIFYKFK